LDAEIFEVSGTFIEERKNASVFEAKVKRGSREVGTRIGTRQEDLGARSS